MDKSLSSALDINKVTKEIRRDTLSVKNRLQSILFDSYFVQTSHQINNVPKVSNERCGLWYVPQEQRLNSCYFKSTDGHTNNWSFSLRRLNFHLLPIIGENGAIAIIDSTRKGKIMPDALLKTIPIWCGVLNSLLFEGMDDEQIVNALQLSDDADEVLDLKANNWLKTPRIAVSKNEHNEISKRIPIFVRELKNLDLINRNKIISDLGGLRPLIPEWVMPDSLGQNDDPFYFGSECSTTFHKIYCVTASKRIGTDDLSTLTVRNGSKVTSWNYIQGAADDHELWATKDVCGGKLGPLFFWGYVMDERNGLVDPDTHYLYDWMSDSELIERMNAIHTEYDQVSRDPLSVSELKGTGISLGAILESFDYSILGSKYPNIENIAILSASHCILNVPDDVRVNIHHYPIESTKKGSKSLRELLPTIIQNLNFSAPRTKSAVIVCDSGTDISVGVALALLCRHYTVDWVPSSDVHVNKDMIKQQLHRILQIRRVNPSRNTLKSVNLFLI